MTPSEYAPETKNSEMQGKLFFEILDQPIWTWNFFTSASRPLSQVVALITTDW